jgi:rubrerythrin
MRIIKELSKQIKEELHDAEKYAKHAMEYKTEYPEVADVYHHLAKEEVSHANLLHDRVVALIRKASSEREVPPVMRELWAWQHEEIVEDQAEVMRLIEMYSMRS